jgi:hypothetical protein
MTISYFDALALKVLRTPQMDLARADMEAQYAADPNAASPVARAMIPEAVANYAMGAAHAAVCDSQRPYLLWRNAAARHYAGLQVPSSKYGTDNPDNVYRWSAIGPGLAYRIEGQCAPHRPSFTTFSLLTGDYSETSLVKTVGILNGTDLHIKADGCFTITIDPQPANGRRNHIQSTEDTALLAIRETMRNWNKELPAHLTIERLGGPPAREPPLDQLASRAAQILRDGAPHWALKFQHDSYEKLPFNQPQPIMSSARRLGGLVTQSSSHGRFALQSDEALVIRVDPFDAYYLGFQLADVWMVSAEYVERLGSLNNAQAKRDADGRYSFVISQVDPGVHNWLDAGGFDTGGTTIRFQGLKDPSIDYGDAFRTWHGKIAELRSILPPETIWVDAAQRKQQIAERVAGYRSRETALLIDVRAMFHAACHENRPSAPVKL